jgi:hypothetical protein
MKLPKKLVHKFVENLPEKLEEGTVYVCMGMATVAHNCCCGCGNEVVTPLSPTDWKLEYDGGTITLYPSIGNWGFACRSHYWIRNSKVKWASQWSEEEIVAGRKYDRGAKAGYFGKLETSREVPIQQAPKGKQELVGWTIWQKLKARWCSQFQQSSRKIDEL